MSLLSIGLFVIFVQSAFSEELLRPCHTEDIACLSEVTENFLEKTSAGLPQFGIKPIDPITLGELDVNVTDSGLVQLRNVTVTGLKKLKIKDFKMDTRKKTVLLLMEANVHIDSDVVNSAEAPDRLTGNTTFIVTASYNYDLKPNEKGDEYFTVGTETLVCDHKVVPIVSYSRQLFPDGKQEAAEKKFLCKIAEVVFHNNIFHNLRASAKLYPKTYYFTNI